MQGEHPRQHSRSTTAHGRIQGQGEEAVHRVAEMPQDMAKRPFYTVIKVQEDHTTTVTASGGLTCAVEDGPRTVTEASP